MELIDKIRVGIVGLGYVGSAIDSALGTSLFRGSKATFDINATIPQTEKSLEDVVHKTDMIFVCVPTPLRNDHSCDTSIVEQVIGDIVSMAETHKIIVIKSTVPPGTTKRLQLQYPAHTILFNPEFLTEANYKEDYLTGDIIVGCPQQSSRILAQTVIEVQQNIIRATNHYIVPGLVCTSDEAELLKYIANTFLAMKVSFANEMFNIVYSDDLDADWDSIVTLLRADDRLGKTHWAVPGPDGKRGFGGTCFPKDLAAFIHYAKTLGIGTPILEAVWNRNVLVDRTERDWELLKGRAVTDN